MLDRGHQLTIAAPPETAIAQAAGRMGIPVAPLGIRRRRLTDLSSVRRWLATNRPRIDVLNTHSSTDSWLAALACATMRDPPPIVRTRHVSTTINQRASTRWLYGRAAHIVTTGEALRGHVAWAAKIPLDRLTSVPTGIDLARFVPANAAVARHTLGLADRRTLGIIATLRTWKGHEYLFKAIALDCGRWREWQVVVVGDGPHRPHLEAQVQALGLGHAVKFVGNQDDVVPWFQALDLFALPSYAEEGVPQAIMQAMACGIPVVSTPIGSIAEIVDHERTGLLVAPRSAEGLALGLARLRDDPALRARIGALSYSRATHDFSIGHMVDRMELIFQRVAGHH
jgi:glycosyltransferase involved in cell wall biosynthesis